MRSKGIADATGQNGGRRNTEVAMRADDLEALAGESFGAARAHQQRYVSSDAMRHPPKYPPSAAPITKMRI